MVTRPRSLLLLPLIASVAVAGVALASDCSRDSTGMVPLIDLGAGSYKGAQGGLYPGGSNQRPTDHNAAGVSIAEALSPLDTLGIADPAHGRIVLISIGMSNGVIEFDAFVPLAMSDPTRNPRLAVINCAEGGQSADRIRYPTAAYWDFVATQLRGHGSSLLQVQAVWLKEANASPTGGFPASAESLTANLGTIVQIIHQKLPNVRLCYFTSRIYAGYATTALNPEPYAYESGFAVKALIAAQIAGVDSLNYDPARGPVRSPWLAWGPYLWADGRRARSDALTWACSEFQSDGTHPDAAGASVVADSLLAFFEKDETTAPWFESSTLSVPTQGATLALSVAPNPARGPLEIRFAAPPGTRWRLEMLDAAGRRLPEPVSGTGSGTIETVRWDTRGSAGRRLRPGIYWIRLTQGTRAASTRLTVLGEP